MLVIKGKNITGLHNKSKVITNVYIKLKNVWNYIRSSFGRGFWVSDSVWNNGDAWKNS